MTPHTTDEKRWQDWCDEFIAAPKEPPNERHMEFMLRMTTIEILPGGFEASGMAQDKDITQAHSVLVFASHAKKLGLKYKPTLGILIAGLKPRLGEVVMYAHACRRIQLRDNIAELGIKEFFIAEFGDGLLESETVAHQLWRKQKLSKEDEASGQFGGMSDNYLDYVRDPNWTPTP